MTKLDGKKIAYLVAQEGVEQIELTDPWKAVERAGGKPVLIAPKSGTVQAFNHLDKADTFTVDETVKNACAVDYDGLVLPGGVANPDQLRTDEDAIDFVREIVNHGIPVAAICHAPWTLIEAEVVRGRHLTSWPSLRTDLINAGADWADEPVRVCDMESAPNVLVTSRKPDDLEVFCETFLGVFAGEPRNHRERANVDLRGAGVAPQAAT